MESIFFVITYIAGYFNATGKKIGSIFSKLCHFLVAFVHNHPKSNDVENVQELTDEEYNRQFSRFFPQENAISDNSFEKRTVSFRKPNSDRFYVRWSDSWM